MDAAAAAAALRALPLRAELQEAADVQIATAFVLFSHRAATDDYFFRLVTIIIFISTNYFGLLFNQTCFNLHTCVLLLYSDSKNTFKQMYRNNDTHKAFISDIVVIFSTLNIIAILIHDLKVMCNVYHS